ncbi:unnamed protein product, partial [Brassica oleracea var. botrytis]
NRSLINPKLFGLVKTGSSLYDEQVKYLFQNMNQHISYKWMPLTNSDTSPRERRIQMAARSSLIRFAFVCIVLAVLVMSAESHAGHHHGPAMAPMPHAHTPAPGAPAPSAATFSAYPQLIATALVGALSFVL